MSILAIPILTAAYALGDRFTGGGVPKLDAKLPGRSVAWAGALTAAAGFAVGGWTLALLGVLWAAYRSVKFWGGSATNWEAAIGRHAIIAPAFPLLAFWGGSSIIVAALAGAAYVANAVALAWWYGDAEADAREAGTAIDPDVNASVELARGAVFGLAAAAGLAL